MHRQEANFFLNKICTDIEVKNLKTGIVMYK